MEKNQGFKDYLLRFDSDDDREERRIYIPEGFQQFVPEGVQEDRPMMVAMLATMLLQDASRTPGFWQRILRKTSLFSGHVLPSWHLPSEKIVVPMGGERFDLLYLLPQLPAAAEGRKVIVTDVNRGAGDPRRRHRFRDHPLFFEEWEYLLRRYYRDIDDDLGFEDLFGANAQGASYFFPFGLSDPFLMASLRKSKGRMVHKIWREYWNWYRNTDWDSVWDSFRPKLFIAQDPNPFYTSIGLPDPSLPWSETSSGANNAIAGVFAKNSEGKEGVTIARHAIKHQPLIPGATKIFLKGHLGTVLSEDCSSDSCFVEIDPSLLGNHPRPMKGVLRGMFPRLQEKVSFTNQNGERTETVISDWSLDLLDIEMGNQVKVFTPPCTNPGDSGTALIDSQDHVVGFAFKRSGIGKELGYSSWIWADSVFYNNHLMY